MKPPGVPSFDSFEGEDDDRVIVSDGDQQAGLAVYLDEGDGIHVRIGHIANVGRRSSLPWEATPVSGTVTFEKRTKEDAARRLYDHYRATKIRS